MHKHSKKIQKVNKREVMETLRQPRNWVLCFIGFCLMISSAGVSGFLPTIVSLYPLFLSLSPFFSFLPLVSHLHPSCFRWPSVFFPFYFILFDPRKLFEFGTLSKRESNLLSSVPNFIALFFLYFWSRRSDKKGERFWHITSAICLAIWGLLFCAISLLFGSLWYFLLASIVYNIGFWAGSSIFLTYPPYFPPLLLPSPFSPTLFYLTL